MHARVHSCLANQERIPSRPKSVGPKLRPREWMVGSQMIASRATPSSHTLTSLPAMSHRRHSPPLPWNEWWVSSATQDGPLLKDGTRRSLSGSGVLEAGMAAEAAGERDSSMGPQPLPAREMLPPRRRPVAAVHHT